MNFNSIEQLSKYEALNSLYTRKSLAKMGLKPKKKAPCVKHKINIDGWPVCITSFYSLRDCEPIAEIRSREELRRLSAICGMFHKKHLKLLGLEPTSNARKTICTYNDNGRVFNIYLYNIEDCRDIKSEGLNNKVINSSKEINMVLKSLVLLMEQTIFIDTDPPVEDIIRSSHVNLIKKVLAKLIEDKRLFLAQKETIECKEDIMSHKLFITQDGKEIVIYSEFLNNIDLSKIKKTEGTGEPFTCNSEEIGFPAKLLNKYINVSKG